MNCMRCSVTARASKGLPVAHPRRSIGSGHVVATRNAVSTADPANLKRAAAGAAVATAAPTALAVPGAQQLQAAKQQPALDAVPRVSLQLPPTELATQLQQAAATHGLALLTDMQACGAPATLPSEAMTRLYARLYADALLAQRLNAVYPARGVFKTHALLTPQEPGNQGVPIDQKVPLDLSRSRLEAIACNDPQLAHDLGDDFEQVLLFFRTVEALVVPPLLAATCTAVAGGTRAVADRLLDMHAEKNFNYRLVDYFPTSGAQVTGTAASPLPSALPPPPRCGEHRDCGTLTVIFPQPGVPGLQYQRPAGGTIGAAGTTECEAEWLDVPATGEPVLMWGWCAAVLSNDRFPAAKHRVVAPPSGPDGVVPRRMSAVAFAAPNLQAELRPHLLQPHEAPRFRQASQSDAAVRTWELKAMIAPRWRAREGFLPGAGAVLQDQDEVVAQRLQ